MCVSTANSAYIYLYTNDGQDPPSFTHTNFVASAYSAFQGIFVADFNGDGANDVVATAVFDFNVVLYYNDPANKGTVLSTFVIDDGTDNVLCRAQYPTGADMNSDGVTDLVVACSDGAPDVVGGRLIYYEANSEGTQFTKHVIDSGKNFYNLALSDVNNDGLIDIIEAGSDIAYYANQIPPPAISCGLKADASGDGKLDVTDIVMLVTLIISGASDTLVWP